MSAKPSRFSPVLALSALETSPEQIKLVVRTRMPMFNVKLELGGVRFTDAFNDEEPLDLKTHVFYLPKKDLTLNAHVKLLFRPLKRLGLQVSCGFPFTAQVRTDPEAIIAQDDNGLVPEETASRILAEGLTYRKIRYRDTDGKPVIVCVLQADPEKIGFYTGTPSDGYASKNVRATIPDMIAAAEKGGINGLAAVNADFFDMFGDHHPSGLCVKNGRTVANPHSRRPFIGVTKAGTPVVDTLQETPELRRELAHAVGGLQMLVRDGKLYELSLLEPFSYVRHPRTAAGITKDGQILLVEVDGRIPAHSNGASLTDLAKLLIAFGADRAVNLDGGGSSAVYIKENGEWKLETVPADLFRPNDKLIRKDYNCIILCEKK
ncbi:MAG: phosphodiester glycosidase family protein [Clostridia bacterium]|nr:phosphodiester glycosidase family protein [Clostridia bacterium]